MKLNNTSCYSMRTSNSKGICQQKDHLSKEYCGFRVEYGDVKDGTQSIKIEE